MSSAAQIIPISKTRLWTGRIISILVIAFLLFDAIAKLMKVGPVIVASAQLGLSESLVVSIGIILLICTIIYAIPLTSFLGAVLLTGYLGGAVAIQMRAGKPLFDTFFAVIFGVLVWAGLFLRDNRLRKLFSPQN